MRHDGEPQGIEYLTLAREHAGERNYERALQSYDRAIKVLRERQLGEALIIAGLEAGATALELSDLPSAERYYSLVQRDAAALGVTPAAFSLRLMELMLMIERGQEQEVADQIAMYLSDGAGGVPVDEALALMQLMGKIYDRNASPLRAASFLIQQCEILERVAAETRDPGDMEEVAKSLFEYGRYLYNMIDACLVESASAAQGTPDEQRMWAEFLIETMSVDPRVGDLRTAIRHEILRSIDLSDWWGPAPRELRFDAGLLRTAVLLELDRTQSAVQEAQRLIPMGELVGASDVVAYLRTVVDLGRPDIDHFGR